MQSEGDPLDERLVVDEAGALTHGNVCSFLQRVAVGAAADRRKSDRAKPPLHRQRQAVAIALGEQLRLFFRPTPPYGSHGVDDEAGRQPVAERDLRLAGAAAAQRAALLQQLRSRRTMDRTVHSAAAE